MAFKYAVKCDLVCGFPRCGFPTHTIDVALKAHMLKGLHTNMKDNKMKITQYSPWGADIQTYPSFRRKKKEFLNRQNKETLHMLADPLEQDLEKFQKKSSQPGPYTKQEKAHKSLQHKVMLIIKSEHVYTNLIQWSYWDVMMYHLFLGLCLLKCKTCGTNFYKIFNVIIYVSPAYGLTYYASYYEFCLFYSHMIDVGLVQYLCF